MLSCTSRRDVAEQTCPAPQKQPNLHVAQRGVASAAVSNSRQAAASTGCWFLAQHSGAGTNWHPLPTLHQGHPTSKPAPETTIPPPARRAKHAPPQHPAVLHAPPPAAGLCDPHSGPHSHTIPNHLPHPASRITRPLLLRHPPPPTLTCKTLSLAPHVSARRQCPAWQLP